jgi:hypothetical protein
VQIQRGRHYTLHLGSAHPRLEIAVNPNAMKTHSREYSISEWTVQIPTVRICNLHLESAKPKLRICTSRAVRTKPVGRISTPHMGSANLEPTNMHSLPGKCNTRIWKLHFLSGEYKFLGSKSTISKRRVQILGL